MNETLKIKIKYFSEDLPEVKVNPKGDLIDLYAAEDTFIEYMDNKLVPLGVAMELPEGYRADLCPRSSTFNNFGIIVVNSIGKIDHTYCGDSDEWKLNAFCLKPKDIVNSKSGTLIHKGDKIAQFEIIKIAPKCEFKVVETLGNTDRGGFGSTGKR